MRYSVSNMKMFAFFLIILSLSSRIYSQSETLRINEFLSLNQAGIKDEDGDFSDWIEIYNPTQEDIDLLNWALTDNKGQPRMWVFPDMTLGKGKYLLIFASGKNRRKAGVELHTNFKLSGDGEYLGLFNPSGKAVTEFAPAYPVQHDNFSYGYMDGNYTTFKTPTPGTENNSIGGTLPATPLFSIKHGFYNSPFTLAISSEPGTAIRYTTDGTAPGINIGALYNFPLNISSTAIIRAVSIKDNQLSRITTQTYLFPDDIIHQPNNPPGYPSTWGSFLSISGLAPADYEMDPEMMADPAFASSVKGALIDLPVISLVTNKDHLFLQTAEPNTGGIYIYTGTANGLGYGWQRPVSFEYFDNSGSLSYQADCGLEIQGGEGRRPEKSPKHSFRLIFRDEYGPSSFNFPIFGDDASNEHNSIILRAGFGNTWIHWSHSQRATAQYINDRWTKDSQLETGHSSSHGNYAHLFINGMYWGVYNPSERLDSEFAQSYLGGTETDYDVIKDYTEAVDGTLIAWNKTISLANAGLSSDAAYQKIRGNNPDGTRNPDFEPMVDVVSLADYMILNFYGGNTDWDHHNWVAIRNRVNPDKGFRFFCWDSEYMVENVNSNIINENNDKCPSRIFQQLRQNKQFRRLFADRIQKLCFNNGVLTPEKAAARWMARAQQLDKAVIAESARWGDYRRDVHPWQTAGPFQLYTRENHWVPQLNFVMNTFFPDRTKNFITQLRAAGLFPSINGPVFMIDNNPVDNQIILPGSMLTMTSDKGTIYYSTDGSDPAEWQPISSIAPGAIQYTKPLSLEESCHIRARVLYNSEWSAATEFSFVIPINFRDLKITEINYHPEEDGLTLNREFEFIEIKNTGTSTLDLHGVKIGGGIDFEFQPETYLVPEAFIILASNSGSFYSKYGFMPFNEYDGQLDNNGELITLISPGKDTLCNVLYSDSGGWPEAPDGNGKTLVPTELNPAGDMNLPESWRESYKKGGSPGEDDLYLTQTGTASKLVTIYQNFPNPFNESTILPYELHEDAHVQLVILDITGRIIAIAEDSDKTAGYHEVSWSGLNSFNSSIRNGLFFYRLVVKKQNETNILTRKMLIIR